MQPLQVWGGPECTVNRVGDAYLDQTQISGHHDRPDDIASFADLGLAAIRYPVLWERVLPHPTRSPDWDWRDDRLSRLRDRGIRPIAGLVHHGSGPPHTGLLDDGFAVGLGHYAGLVAQRYPWIDDWTPINEPLTTARFSCLYGHWYPHARDEDAFWRALLNQVDATRAAMRAVRRVNPAARLIQTDDLGRTYATTRLADQAAFDNLRRWAGWDLLFGRVTRHHPLWEMLCRYGHEARLAAIADDPCPPDVVGVNHYLTSDRFLDHRLERYPPHSHGGNSRLAYADIEAIRVLDPPPGGMAGALGEAWARYRVPLAITEVHNGCTREEQLRWAAEAWDVAVALRETGIGIEAVTAWALLGSQGWNTLLTAAGAYEPGLFDVSGKALRPTALAKLWSGLPRGAPRHPVTGDPGWWRRPERLLYPPVRRPAPVERSLGTGEGAVLLICGATGTLGQAFVRACVARGLRYKITDRKLFDLERLDDLGAALDSIRPWGVVNAAGWVRVDEAEEQEQACHRVNATGTTALAQACAARAIAHMCFSSDLVFDGTASRPYTEDSVPNPLNAYGRSKAAMEAGCADLPGSLIVRTAAFFSARDQHNFAWAAAQAMARRRPFPAANDHVVSPTFVPALVDAALDLLIDGADGIWHLAGAEAVSWAELGERVGRACALDTSLIAPKPGVELGWQARRPAFAALASERGAMPGSLDAHIEVFAREWQAARHHVLLDANAS